MKRINGTIENQTESGLLQDHPSRQKNDVKNKNHRCSRHLLCLLQPPKMPFWRSATDSQLKDKAAEVSPAKNGTTAKKACFLEDTDGKRHLPRPRGPHRVGFVDVVTAGAPHENRGDFVRILYPTEEAEDTAMWPVWEEDAYITGMLSFMQVGLP